MSGVAAAIGGAAVIGAAASSSAADKASSAQATAAGKANQTQASMYYDQANNQRPYIGIGGETMYQLQHQMNSDGTDSTGAYQPSLQKQFTMSDFQRDPGYQFTLDQGTQAMQRSAAAKGMLNSAGTMQNLNNYAQGQASNQFQNAYQRFTDNQKQRYNMLAGVAGMGNTANGQMAQVGMNAANNIGNAQMGAGNAQSAAYMAQGNSLTNAVNTGANGYMNMSMMNKMYPGGGGGAMPATNTAGFNALTNGQEAYTMPAANDVGMLG